MNPIVVSETCQVFRGAKYWRSQSRFMRHGRLLHRAVWEAAHGPIPAGHHIHHRNHDWRDNRLENLECLPAVAHKSHHAKQRRSMAWRRAMSRSITRFYAAKRAARHHGN